MPSFDIVSGADLQEARNAVDNASREVESRFDFRNVEASFELNDASKTIKVLSESDFQVNQLLDILRAKLLKRGIEAVHWMYRKISFIAVKPGLWKRN